MWDLRKQSNAVLAAVVVAHSEQSLGSSQTDCDQCFSRRDVAAADVLRSLINCKGQRSATTLCNRRGDDDTVYTTQVEYCCGCISTYLCAYYSL